MAADPARHTVGTGETLWGIAHRFGTTVQQLALLNNIKYLDRIRVGMVLRLPSRSVERPADGGGITGTQLLVIMPTLPPATAALYFPFLDAAMAEGRIISALRISAFVAQLAHESVELRFFEEIASGAAYEGRQDLGNVQPGDGKRFKGRGPIQLTGRANYAAAAQALDVDLVGDPRLAATKEQGFRVAEWFWTTRDLNTLADQCRFDDITRRINGGLNGKASRDQYYARARQVLGIPVSP
jgi:predicted chitinase